MWNWFKLNWKTNLTATVAVIYSAQQFTSAVMAWENHQPANWRTGVMSLVVAAGLYAAKDGSTHSTEAQVQASTAVITNAPNAPALVKAADAQVAAKK
jgi:hypothetical protein